MVDLVDIPEPLDNLSPEQKQLREQFVERYVIDYDPIRACKEMGYHRDWCLNVSEQFMNCPYVARRIREYEDNQDADESVETRRLFAALRREASFQGRGASHAARVAALSKLASLRGMDKPIKHEMDVTNRGGVMVVPGMASVDDWEKAATESQAALQKGTQET
jgi:hypothetical protein